jgi:hypothetical protein
MNAYVYVCMYVWNYATYYMHTIVTTQFRMCMQKCTCAYISSQMRDNAPTYFRKSQRTFPLVSVTYGNTPRVALCISVFEC